MKKQNNLVCVKFDNLNPTWVNLQILVESHDCCIRSYLLHAGYSLGAATQAQLNSKVIDSEGEFASYFAKQFEYAQDFFSTDSRSMLVIKDYYQNLYNEGGFNIAIWTHCVDTTNSHEEAMYKALNIQIISDMDEYIDNTVLMNFRENEDVYRYFDREAYLRDCILNGEYKDMGDDLYIVC